MFSASSLFNLENYTPRSKSSISNEELENFFSAITKLGHDAAQLAAAKEAEHQTSNSNQIETSGNKPETSNLSDLLNENSKSRASETNDENENSNTNLIDDEYSNEDLSDFFDDDTKRANVVASSSKETKPNKTSKLSKTNSNKSLKSKKSNSSKRGLSTNKNPKKRRHRTSSSNSKILNDDEDETLTSFKSN